MSDAHTQRLFVQLKFKSLKLTMNAALQRRFGSPFIFREEDPSRQVGRSHTDPLGALGMLQHPVLMLSIPTIALYHPQSSPFLLLHPAAVYCDVLSCR